MLFLAGGVHGRYESAAIIKRKEPINRVPLGYGLSALRLCVWLFDNCHIELCDMN